MASLVPYGKGDGREEAEVKVKIIMGDILPLLDLKNRLFGTLSITGNEKWEPVKIMELKSDTDFIDLSQGKSGKYDIMIIKLNHEEKIETGYYTITANLRNKQGRVAMAHVTVNIIHGN